MKNVLLVVAAAALLSACGNPDTPTPEPSLEPGASVMGGVVIDYGSDANLLTAGVFGDYSGGFIYTPLANTKIVVVPASKPKSAPLKPKSAPMPASSASKASAMSNTR